MIGLGEILIIMASFCLIWFLLFKIKLLYDTKKVLENIEEKIAKQTGDLFTNEDKRDFKEKLGLQKEQEEDKVEEKKSIFGFLKRKK